MKVCGSCGEEKPKSEFHKNSRRYDGLQSMCISCRKAYNRKSYVESPERRKAIRNRNARYVAYVRKLLRRIRRLKGCLLCGEKEPVALDLHHVDPAIKDHDPATLVGYGIDTVRSEIRKCVVLCSNCHRKVHAGILELPLQ